MKFNERYIENNFFHVTSITTSGFEFRVYICDEGITLYWVSGKVKIYSLLQEVKRYYGMSMVEAFYKGKYYSIGI